jgi:hypothetical protein
MPTKDPNKRAAQNQRAYQNRKARQQQNQDSGSNDGNMLDAFN